MSGSEDWYQAQRLLGAYPMASATPVTHAARHLAPLTVTAAPPSFAQPVYYDQTPPPYTEYAEEIAYMTAAKRPVDNSGYWQNTRDAAVTLIDEEARRSHPYPNHWSRSSNQSSGYSSLAPLAQSLFQHVAPAGAYPTPPPPNLPPSSSSSLANALGPSPSLHNFPVTKNNFQPEQSAQFFDNFLDQKSRQAEVQQRTPITPSHSETRPKDSPDPLSIISSPAVPVTPRKRKAFVEISSPSIKRIHSNQSLRQVSPTKQPLPSPSLTSTPGSAVPRTPTTAGPSTPTSKPISGRSTTTMLCVEIPRKPWLTPSSMSKKPFITPSHIRTNDTDSPDLGGYGSPLRNTAADSTAGSLLRTGDRDDRGPLEKFLTLVEDIFEAEDSISPDGSADDLPPMFSRSSTDASRPQLELSVVRKLVKYIDQVARPNSRLRHGTNAAMSTPRSKGHMAEVDPVMLTRILRLLNRTMKRGEDLEPFPSSGAAMKQTSPKKAASKKSGKSKNDQPLAKAPSPTVEQEDGDATIENSDIIIGEAELQKLSDTVNTARDSVVAAECCLALLGSDRLPKQLYSEEIITTCMSIVKTQLTNIIYPFVEASADAGSTLSGTNPLLAHIIKNSCEQQRRHLSDLFRAITATLPRTTVLVNTEGVAMSDTIIIQAVYIAIGPFFVVDAGEGDSKSKKETTVMSTFGRSAMRGLRLDALSLIRSIFGNHEDQRSWIIEEILTSLIKLSDTKQKAGQFRLRDGRSIKTVSALLLQLVQSSAHDVRLEAKKIRKARDQSFALRRQESLTESPLQAKDQPFLDAHDQEEIRLYSSGLDSANKAAKTIILFLTQRSGKGKATKNANEAEYRAIFDNLISDVLTVLYWPEWPAAGLILDMACKYMISSLSDIETATQTDNNAAKTIALDHLGVVAARLRTCALGIQKKQESDTSPRPKPLKPLLEQIVPSLDVNELKKYLSASQQIASYLSKHSTEDQAYDSAQELNATTLGYGLAEALKRVDNWDSNDEDPKPDPARLDEFGKTVKEALRSVWRDQTADVFDVRSQEESARIDRIAESLGTVSPLSQLSPTILNVILKSLGAQAIFMRTKALRALGQIVTSDASILSAANVRKSIERPLLDQSPAVRDAAVELIGKYMIDSPSFTKEYYPKIADRIADTGLGVRKRVIKLLKSYYSIIAEPERQVDVASRLVLRLLDEDDGVKDLAAKSLQELWFPAQSSDTRVATSSTERKNNLLKKVVIIMGVAAYFKDRQSPLEDLLYKTKADNSALYVSHCQEICEALIDGLVDAADIPGFTIINCIRTIYLFASVHPAIITATTATTLLPYLKTATSPEEQSTAEYLLKIYSASIPHMPKTSAMFGAELQSVLQPMILKPSTIGGVNVLQETIACMCAVVQHLTRDHARLVTLLKSLNNRLKAAIRSPKEFSVAEVKAMSMLAFIIALLVEHCDFDLLRRENSLLRSDLDDVSEGSIIEHVYNTLLQLHKKTNNSGLRGRIVQCLGFLFRAQPTLMTRESSAEVMDSIFACDSDPEGLVRLLGIIQDFLVSESLKYSQLEKDAPVKRNQPLSAVNMDELIGNTDGFADSGVSSAVVQRYLMRILDAALSVDHHIHGPAIDILTFTVKQGLAHPLQSFPIIVALETSSNTTLSQRASGLHAIMHTKHTSLLNTRYTASARTSFEYQTKLTEGLVRGYRLSPTPTALLQRWYSLVREKRPTRQEFLKALVKVFQEKSPEDISQDEIHFIRYMSENFATFEYKTLEEVLTVIKYLTTVLSTTGTNLLETISPSHLLAQLHDNNVEPSAQAPLSIPLMRSSVIIGMVIVLRSYLKHLYSLNEEKCTKFVIGKKSAIGDKPATKRHHKPIEWDRLPFAEKPLLTESDAELQKSHFLTLWNQDGVQAEAEDEMEIDVP